MVAIRFGQLATTRRACVPAVMDQEGSYLKELEGAERAAREGPYLLIIRRTGEPLRFIRRGNGSDGPEGRSVL